MVTITPMPIDNEIIPLTTLGCIATTIRHSIRQSQRMINPGSHGNPELLAGSIDLKYYPISLADLRWLQRPRLLWKLRESSTPTRYLMTAWGMLVERDTRQEPPASASDDGEEPRHSPPEGDSERAAKPTVAAIATVAIVSFFITPRPPRLPSTEHIATEGLAITPAGDFSLSLRLDFRIEVTARNCTYRSPPLRHRPGAPFRAPGSRPSRHP